MPCRHFMFVACCLLSFVTCLSVVPAFAQRDAGAKARGDFFFYGHSSHSHLRGARSHAIHYGRYLAGSREVSPRITLMANTAITQHLVQAHQHLDAIQGEIEKSGDTESLAAMKEVNDRLDAAKKQHAALQAAMKPGADPSVVAGQAEKLQQALDRSIESHDALLEKLKIPPPDAASP